LLRSLESAAARLDRREAERDLGFVFVGAGYAGVEALAELNDLAHEAVRRSYPTLRDVRQRWALVDAIQLVAAGAHTASPMPTPIRVIIRPA
jgi:NADH dehydrogenase